MHEPSGATAYDKVSAALLAARNPHGHWTGELSSSALATATAVCALAVAAGRLARLETGPRSKNQCPHGRDAHAPRVDTDDLALFGPVAARNSAEPRREIPALIGAGLAWLAANQNRDGGWGDTGRSRSNISTTTLVWAAFGAVPGGVESRSATVEAAETWLRARAGSLEPARLARAIAARYGKDRTFSIPILTMCAIAGRLGPGGAAWGHVGQLPFELAALPAAWFGAVRLPVVSYALPALIAIGQARHHFRPSRNPLLRRLRDAVRDSTLRTLTRIQPPNGGFLEAVPLTAFVTMSLAAMRLDGHPVVTRGLEFLVRSARADGSWAIDTDLATWLTTLAIQALGGVDGALPAPAAQPIRSWLLGQQSRAIHPYTRAAPGGWGWTDQPGGVPDADDTAGALLALRQLGPADATTRDAAAAGAQWLVDLQNADGGIPTFCKGWGALPFDRSSPDITAHALRAWTEWHDALPPALGKRTGRAISRALGFLAKNQRPDGSWIPLWFGHEESPGEENPLYGTSRVLLALRSLSRPQAVPLAAAAERWIVANQNPDGGWSGAPGAASSVEETSLALEALAAHPAGGAAEAAAKGTAWLTARVASGQWHEAAPIGFYFARLWYYERLYPLIFAAAALKKTSRPMPASG